MGKKKKTENYRSRKELGEIIFNLPPRVAEIERLIKRGESASEIERLIKKREKGFRIGEREGEREGLESREDASERARIGRRGISKGAHTFFTVEHA